MNALDHNCSDRVFVRHRFVNDAHVVPFRVALEHDVDEWLSREPARIKQQHGIPAALPASDITGEAP